MTLRHPSIIVAMMLASVGLIAVMAVSVKPRFIWNGSPSAPIGLYRLDKGVPDRGDFVLVDPPAAFAELISRRGYLPPHTPLLKRVAALGGDVVCRDEVRILINGKLAAIALPEDVHGRPMPQWRGCVTLKPGEIFLLNKHPNSLDGRYFGIVRVDDVIGVAAPLWVRR